MPNTEKQSRRKNLTFRPKGDNPVHDEAVRILEQIGRGMCDLTATAIVYYIWKLSEGTVEPEFAKLLNSHPSRPKLLVVQKPLVEQSAKPSAPDVLPASAGTDTAISDTGEPQDEEPKTKYAPDFSAKQLPESYSQQGEAPIGTRSALPADIINRLVMGFGGEK
jgi:hypothetical protein